MEKWCQTDLTTNTVTLMMDQQIFCQVINKTLVAQDVSYGMKYVNWVDTGMVYSRSWIKHAKNYDIVFDF